MSDQIWRIQRQIDNQQLAVTEVDFAGTTFVVRQLAPGKYTANAMGEDAVPSATAFADLASNLLRKGYLPQTQVRGEGKTQPVNTQFRSSNREVHPVTTAERPGLTAWSETQLPWVRDTVRMFASASSEQMKLGIVLSEDSVKAFDETVSSFLTVPDVGMDTPFEGVSLMYNSDQSVIALSLLYEDPEDLISIRERPETCPTKPPTPTPESTPIPEDVSQAAAGRKLMTHGGAHEDGDVMIDADSYPPYNGEYPWRGEVRFYQHLPNTPDPKWFYICKEGWNDAEANVVCRQLGYLGGKTVEPSCANLPPPCGGSGNAADQAIFDPVTLETISNGYALNFLTCNGDENSLLDASCGDGQRELLSCPTNYEATVICNVPLDLRLVDGPEGDVSRGRLEVKQAGATADTYGTVCSTNFGEQDASVACKQLGFRGGVPMPDGGSALGFGKGAEDQAIRLTELACTGDEENMGACDSVGFNEPNTCTHNNDVGIACYVEERGAAPYDSIRLAGGQTTAEGRVEIFHDDVWGTICGKASGNGAGWTQQAADAVCRELNFPWGGWTAKSDDDYTDGNVVDKAGGAGPMWLGTYVCDGDEMNFKECTSGSEFTETQVSGTCTDRANDVAGVFCKSPFDVRLMDGEDGSQGRVEVKGAATNNEWSSVCPDEFQDVDAKVICRQLGFHGGFQAPTGTFADGTGVIQVSKVHCSGSEQELGLCEIHKFRPDNCHHSQDVGLMCYNEDKDPLAKPGSVRFAGSDSSSSGRVEILVTDEYNELVWGTMCNAGWTADDVTSLCGALGWPYGGTTAGSETVSDRGVYGAGPMWYGKDISCDQDQDFAFCTKPAPVNARERDDCQRSDTLFLSCATGAKGAVRLSGGANLMEGRVDFYVAGSKDYWGSVCGAEFDDENARVVCRQMGHTYGKAVDATDGRYGLPPDTQPAVLSRLRCTGYEARLGTPEGGIGHDGPGDILLCNAGSNGKDEKDNCDGHGNYAAVQCFSREPGDAGSVRLNGDSTGVLQYYEGRKWGHICAGGVGETEAIVACRELGFAHGKVQTTPVDYNTARTEPVYSALSCPSLGATEITPSCSAVLLKPEDAQCDAASIACLDDEPNDSGKNVRLSRGTDKEGLVEVYANGRWGSVCSEEFDATDAAVVCRDVAGTRWAEIITNTYGQSYGPVQLSDVDCDGPEDSLLSCDNRGVGVAGECDHSNDVAIRCLDNEPNNGKGVRIAGESDTTGRVEVYHTDGHGQWYSVCADDFTDEEAAVVCKMSDDKYLWGLALDSIAAEEYMDGAQAVQLSGVKCTGYENSLLDCTGGDQVGTATCPSGKKAAVRCLTAEPGPLGGVAMRIEGGDLTDYDGLTKLEGLVRIYRDDQWRSVCDNGFDNVDASVACRALGFSKGGERVVNTWQAPSGSSIGATRVECDGDEGSLAECDSEDETSACTHAEDVGVRCYGNMDGEVNIYDASTQRDQSSKGRVQVRRFGSFGTVCTDDFDDRDASVLCRAAGFTGGEVEDDVTFTGLGRGNLVLDKLGCTGSERDVLACPRSPRSNNCRGRRAAGVRCVEAQWDSCSCDDVACEVNEKCMTEPAMAVAGFTKDSKCTPYMGLHWMKAGSSVAFTTYDSKYTALTAVIPVSQLQGLGERRSCSVIPMAHFDGAQPVRYCLSYSETTKDYVVTFDRWQAQDETN